MKNFFLKTIFIVNICIFCFGVGYSVTVTDILGRHVDIKDHPTRIILGEGRLIYAFQPLEKKDLFSRIVGWQGEFKEADEQNYNELRKLYPQAEKVAVIGRGSAESISPEKILDLHPDLAVFSITGHGPGQSDAVMERLKAAHIPVIFVDFRSKPVLNTVSSMSIIGRAIGRDKEAKEYNDFYTKRLLYVEQIIKNIPISQRPSVFINMLAGARLACCHTSGLGNMGSFIKVAGGNNVADKILPADIGDISIEALITMNPDILILDGTKSPNYKGSGLKMGAEVTRQQARFSLDNLVQSPEFSVLKAIKEKHYYGLWHSFYDSPFNILAIEVMAKWFFPKHFSAMDPYKDLKEISQNFYGIPETGTYWVEPNQ